MSYVHSVSELTESDSVALTWFDQSQATMVTTVHDLATGEETARGLTGDVRSVATATGDLVSASAGRLTRSSASLDPLLALSKSGVAPVSMQATRDDLTLFLAGYDEHVALYDLQTGRRLGDDIPTGAGAEQWWPSGFISADGKRMNERGRGRTALGPRS